MRLRIAAVVEPGVLKSAEAPGVRIPLEKVDANGDSGPVRIIPPSAESWPRFEYDDDWGPWSIAGESGPDLREFIHAEVGVV